ncbi:hypothetical protein BBJ29_008709 [Phytophthora kernoviae]|uniref:Uncharacterized protein n=1 Tax=Phytophthora kernoviae TaxID=325452 RepID=A0A3F2RVM7_9STRA|nr:hypothetical protein BBJ29_008709 [Phytophthora kernoviae]RLN65120.1 hypothetical protein BBP00_00003035 [Phytophthora kernoviae]
MNSETEESGLQDNVDQTFVPSSAASLQEAVNTVHELNAQLKRFENDMAMKLDYLDDRVSKLCYLVLPPRLS